MKFTKLHVKIKICQYWRSAKNHSCKTRGVANYSGLWCNLPLHLVDILIRCLATLWLLRKGYKVNSIKTQATSNEQKYRMLCKSSHACCVSPLGIEKLWKVISNNKAFSPLRRRESNAVWFLTWEHYTKFFETKLQNSVRNSMLLN